MAGKEIFKPIKEHPGYSVSNYGRIKKASVKEPGKERLMSIDTNKYTIRFTKKGVPKSYKVSTLVAHAFLEPADGRRKIRHKDGDESNNHYTNLEWTGLTRAQVREIKIGLRDGKSMGQMAKKFGVERTFIRKIRDEEAWKEVEI